jgi:hypothetical protein
MKFLSIFTLDPESFCAGPPKPETVEAMDRLIKEMMDSGVLVDTGGVAPTGVSMRVRRSNGSVAITDGPFAESKEVIGGFALLNVSSKDEALAATHRFLECVGSGTCDLHEIGETPHFE